MYFCDPIFYSFLLILVLFFVCAGKEGEPPNLIFDRSFKTLILMSSNVECLERIIKEFLRSIGKFLNLFQTKNLQFMCVNTSTFLHRILQVNKKIIINALQPRTRIVAYGTGIG